jgi:hypothetical protein
MVMMLTEVKLVNAHNKKKREMRYQSQNGRETCKGQNQAVGNFYNDFIIALKKKVLLIFDSILNTFHR